MERKSERLAHSDREELLARSESSPPWYGLAGSGLLDTVSKAKDLITSNPRISLVGGLVEPSIDPHSRHSGRDPGFSAGNTGKPDNDSSISPVCPTRKSYGTVFPESLSPPCLKLHGTCAGAHLRRRPRDTSRGSHCATGRLQQNCEVMYSLVQRLSVSGKCAGRWPPLSAGPTR